MITTSAWSALAQRGPPPPSRWRERASASRSTGPRVRVRSPAAAPSPTRSCPLSPASMRARPCPRSSRGGWCSRTRPDRASRSTPRACASSGAPTSTRRSPRPRRRAGARLVASRVEEVRPGPGGVEVRAGGERHRHDFVVGADGARGLCRRSLGLPPGAESIGLGASLCGSGARVASRSDFPTPPTPTAGSSRVPAAPRWGSPTTRPGSRTAPRAAALDRFLDRHLDGRRSGPRRRQALSLSDPDLRRVDALRRASRGARSRVLLVGDAAGVADPLTREGIR